MQSELGMSQNLYLARHFSDIDVMYSAHTHEVTLGALLAQPDEVTRTTPGEPLSGSELGKLVNGAAIVVETNRDMYVGRLDLTVTNGKVTNFRWEAIPTTGKEDKKMAKLVDWIEDPFLDGGKVAVQRHTFMPGGYCTDPEAVPNPNAGGAPSIPDNCGDTTQHGRRTRACR